MRLTAKPILNFNTVNSFSYGNQWIIRFADPNTLYFQLQDLDQASLRYLTGVGSQNQPVQITVVFPSIDNSKVINLLAVPVALDGSIWSIPVPSSITPFSGNVQFIVSEGSNTRRFFVLDMLKVEYPQSCGSDGVLPTSPTTYGNPEGI